METNTTHTKEPNTATQNAWVLKQLRAGRRITAFEAVHKAGIYRLAARVNNLRKMGHDIKTHMVYANDRNFAVYYLEQ